VANGGAVGEAFEPLAGPAVPSQAGGARFAMAATIRLFALFAGKFRNPRDEAGRKTDFLLAQPVEIDESKRYCACLTGIDNRIGRPYLFARPMRTVTCTLTFTDGKKVMATASARSENENVRFDYSGDTSRFQPFGDKGTVGFFEWYLRGIAANYNANIEVTTEGDFD